MDRQKGKGISGGSSGRGRKYREKKWQDAHVAVRRHAGAALATGLSLALLVTGCGTLENGRGWGEDLVLRADGERFGRVVRDAFFDWQTIGPLVGAAVFAVDDFDERTSDWATKHNPIFGSDRDARDASDDVRDLLRYEAIATAVLTASGDDCGHWACSKAKGAGVELGAFFLTDGVTSSLKSWSDRERPDGSNDKSFPSGHSSQSFALATLSNRNLDYIDVPRGVKRSLQIANIGAASSVAWARVEGKMHYPSDVLFGAALGHFVTRVVHDYFLELPETDRFDLRIGAYERGAVIEAVIAF